MITLDTYPPRISSIRPAGFDDLDEVIFEGRESYVWPRLERDRRRLGWVRSAAAYHCESSLSYRRLAERRRFRPESLTATEDLATVPLLSSGTFKRGTLQSSNPGVCKLCTSSGTRGTRSVVPRDRRTLERYAGTIMHALREFVGQVELRKGYVLGPPALEAGDLWFSYSLGLAELLSETEHFVNDGVFEVDRLIKALEDHPPSLQPVIVSPPGLLLDALDRLSARRCQIDLANGVVITAGGWKRHKEKAIEPEELRERVGEHLGIRHESCRDAFNMVELNTLVFECERHRKHVPPWLTVMARDPRDMRPLADGEVGVLSYLDPTARSYPAFVLSDDLGRVTDGPCECGRQGEMLVLERRLSSVEERGCALKMDRYAGGHSS